MKRLSLIINESKQNDIVELLQQLKQVSAYTIFHGEGHFPGHIAPFESIQDEVMGFVPRIYIDLLLEDADVKAVLAEIKKCGSCDAYGGVYWISPVDSMGTL
ncbi:MAG: DUF3240 family protein [Deltaproteobacteria bacterium]|nr:DUF3240 family protein [Deltaproteobacteria bacterium]